MVQVPAATTQEINRYHMARRFLMEGLHDNVLVLAAELMSSSIGQQLAHSLLTEMYPTSRTMPGSATNYSFMHKRSCP